MQGEGSVSVLLPKGRIMVSDGPSLRARRAFGTAAHTSPVPRKPFGVRVAHSAPAVRVVRTPRWESAGSGPRGIRHLAETRLGRHRSGGQGTPSPSS